MLKKFLVAIWCLSFSYAIADQNTVNNNQSSSNITIPATATTSPTTAKQLNNPTVGSRQSGSEQIFGEPKLTQDKPPSSSPRQGGSTEPNNPNVGGRQSGSEQLFGQSATPAATSQKYTKPNINRGDSNSPTVGGRQSGSEQLFGQSAIPTNSTPSK